MSLAAAICVSVGSITARGRYSNEEMSESDHLCTISIALCSAVMLSAQPVSSSVESPLRVGIINVLLLATLVSMFWMGNTILTI